MTKTALANLWLRKTRIANALADSRETLGMEMHEELADRLTAARKMSDLDMIVRTLLDNELRNVERDIDRMGLAIADEEANPC